jgi:hypothetical protein
MKYNTIFIGNMSIEEVAFTYNIEPYKVLLSLYLGFSLANYQTATIDIGICP